MANPSTCKHNVIMAGVAIIDNNFKAQLICCSCDTDVTEPELRFGKNYQYDIDNNVWVHRPNCCGGEVREKS